MISFDTLAVLLTGKGTYYTGGWVIPSDLDAV
jgi:hypothetical protein